MFGERVRSLRDELKLSQKELAGKLGVSQQAVGKWEQGKSQPDIDTIKAMASVFNVTIDYLLGRTNARNEPTTLALHTEHDYEDLPDEAREDIRQFIEFVKTKYGKENPEEE